MIVVACFGFRVSGFVLRVASSDQSSVPDSKVIFWQHGTTELGTIYHGIQRNFLGGLGVLVGRRGSRIFAVHS
jgi:hypothetical protein